MNVLNFSKKFDPEKIIILGEIFPYAKLSSALMWKHQKFCSHSFFGLKLAMMKNRCEKKTFV
jgi:hypothetical protein